MMSMLPVVSLLLLLTSHIVNAVAIKKAKINPTSPQLDASTIQDMPNSILDIILENLDNLQDIANAKTVNKDWNSSLTRIPGGVTCQGFARGIMVDQKYRVVTFKPSIFLATLFRSMHDVFIQNNLPKNWSTLGITLHSAKFIWHWIRRFGWWRLMGEFPDDANFVFEAFRRLGRCVHHVAEQGFIVNGFSIQGARVFKVTSDYWKLVSRSIIGPFDVLFEVLAESSFALYDGNLVLALLPFVEDLEIAVRLLPRLIPTQRDGVEIDKVPLLHLEDDKTYETISKDRVAALKLYGEKIVNDRCIYISDPITVACIADNDILVSGLLQEFKTAEQCQCLRNYVIVGGPVYENVKAYFDSIGCRE